MIPNTLNPHWYFLSTVPTTTTSETIKLKINIAKVDYGYQEKMSIMLQESLISKIHQRINDL